MGQFNEKLKPSQIVRAVFVKQAVQNGFLSDLADNTKNHMAWGAGLGLLGGPVSMAVGATAGAVTAGATTAFDHGLHALTGRDTMGWGSNLWDRGTEWWTGKTRMQRDDENMTRATPWTQAQQFIPTGSAKPDMATRQYTKTLQDPANVVAALRAPGKPGVVSYLESTGSMPKPVSS